MAKSASKKKTPTSRGHTPAISTEKKLEILGVLLIAVGLLLAVSIVTYVPGDYGVIHSLSLSNVVNPNSGPALRIHNGLGIVGAYISYFFVIMFGYPSTILPIILIAYGWVVFRQKPLNVLNRFTVLCVAWLLLIITCLGWVFMGKDVFMSWYGASGAAFAEILRKVTGYYGSIILLVAFLFIAILFTLDWNIQQTLDRFKHGYMNFKERSDEKKRLRQLKKEAKQKQKATIAANQERITAEEKLAARSKKTPVGVGKQPGNNDDPKKIIEESNARARERFEREIEEQREDHVGRRALLEKDEEVEVDENDPAFNVRIGEEEEEAGARDLEKQQKDKEKGSPVIRYKFPTIDLPDSPPNEGKEVDLEEINEKKYIILDKLKRHGIEILSIDAVVGPTVTLYELTPAPDVKISKIESYANDLKMAMATHGLRIIAPIPGKSAVGIEVPNNKRETVYIKSIINTKKFVDTSMDLPVAFGKTIENEVFMVDLGKLPHLLIAGATGSGKSVGINTIITCLLYKCHPEDLKFVLIDPKKIELSLYRNIQNYFLAYLPDAEEPIITDTSKVLETLTSVCKEMDDRYELLKLAMVRDINSYNEKYKKDQLDEEEGHRHLPYIVVVIDELADLMITAGKKIEEPIARIAQLARAVGIHMVIATQRPSVNVITGTIKANFPARIAYQVASKVDSRTILDTMGADQLIGRGDMLFSGGGPMVRIQNAFVSTEEVERITEFIGTQIGYKDPYLLPVVDESDGSDGRGDPLSKTERDELFEDAAQVVVMHQQGSVSLLQRKLRLGYNRAGRIIDQLYQAGIVGPYQGSTAREVLVETEEELDDILRNLDD
ncbi:MAG TPA: DNA translocase FtsK [Balneolales bacterium]|nr:DNA translocase FtsK [Balneolales bacterium]